MDLVTNNVTFLLVHEVCHGVVHGIASAAAFVQANRPGRIHDEIVPGQAKDPLATAGLRQSLLDAGTRNQPKEEAFRPDIPRTSGGHPG